MESVSRVDRDWNDEDVLPPVLSRDTDFVFRRMTEETLRAVDARRSVKVLDVGCGRGIDAAALARQGGILFGCEPSRVMLRKAREGLKNCGVTVLLVSSLAERLPFRSETFQRVVCKGAIDHFLNPEHAVAEMCRVVSPGGKVVISVANFESLSCSLARGLDRLTRTITGRGIPPPHIWEIPRDHLHKFDYPSTLAIALKHLRVESVRGVSLFWGFPRWANFLRNIPGPLAQVVLRGLDWVAHRCPDWSDVLVVTGIPRNGSPAQERSS